MSARGTCNARHSVQAGCSDPECYRYGSLDAAFAKALRETRELQGLTQTALAERVNRMLSGSWGVEDSDRTDDVAPVASQQISDWEHGRRPAPGPLKLRALADALGVSMDYLCGREHRRNGERYPL